MRNRKLTLSLLPGEYAICKLEPMRHIPEWATRNAFWSVTPFLQKSGGCWEAHLHRAAHGAVHVSGDAQRNNSGNDC